MNDPGVGTRSLTECGVKRNPFLSFCVVQGCGSTKCTEWSSSRYFPELSFFEEYARYRGDDDKGPLSKCDKAACARGRNSDMHTVVIQNEKGASEVRFSVRMHGRSGKNRLLFEVMDTVEE